MESVPSAWSRSPGSDPHPRCRPSSAATPPAARATTRCSEGQTTAAPCAARPAQRRLARLAHPKRSSSATRRCKLGFRTPIRLPTRSSLRRMPTPISWRRANRQSSCCLCSAPCLPCIPERSGKSSTNSRPGILLIPDPGRLCSPSPSPLETRPSALCSILWPKQRLSPWTLSTDLLPECAPRDAGPSARLARPANMR